MVLLSIAAVAACSPPTLTLHRCPTGATAVEWAAWAAPKFRRLDERCFPPTGLWSERQYTREIMHSASELLCVWHAESELIAFSCTERVLDESHMLSLAVHPEWRGRGLARTLVLASLLSARAAQQRLMTLEVRESNTAAIGLYRSCGLGEVGRRPKYYKRPDEDALLLSRSFVEEEPFPSSSSSGGEGDSSGVMQTLEEMLEASGAHEPSIRRAADDALDGDSEASAPLGLELGHRIGEKPLGTLLGELSV